MLDWIFEGIVTWISSVVSDMMDAVSGLFLQALGTDMTAMEEYFPFVSKAFTVMQYTAWALLFLITVWQLFRVFGGPVTEAENPWVLLGRSALFAFLIGYAKPIFLLTLKIATAPYTALMDIQMTAEDFTFAGIEQALQNGLTSLIATISVVGLLLLTILEIALGWNYFKLLLETVERYIVVGVLCYTSPLAFSMGASKATTPVFRSWCRMVGSQLLLLVMNVWFLRGFSTSVDIRDMPGATWRDVIAAVLETCKEPVALSFLYEQIEPHKKAQSNKWWKEKIRQTLQINPMHFTHDGRGLWSLNRNAA